MSRLSEVIGGGGGGGGGGSVVTETGVLTGWTPTDEDPDLGGPDSTNPLLTSEGYSAIDPEWPEMRSFSAQGVPGVIYHSPAGEGSSRVNGLHTRRAHERGAIRRVRLEWAQASGGDVELVRRALQVTKGGAGRTRFRHPMLDPDGPVETAPWIRFVPGTLSVRRSPDGSSAAMAIEYEYLE